MTVRFTAEERDGWIKFCEEVAEEFEIAHDDFNTLTDEQLDKAADWFYYLTGK